MCSRVVVCVYDVDEDVLDTWFSSGLFPFSIFGWPDTVSLSLITECGRMEGQGCMARTGPDCV